MKKTIFLISTIILCITIGAFWIYKSNNIKVAIVGDILLTRGVGEAIKQNGPSYPYEQIKGLLKNSDIVFGNLECPITKGGTPVLKMKNLIFKADGSSLPPLRDAGFNVLGIANNHSMDYGPKGLLDTVQALNKNGIAVSGGGANKESAHKPVYIHSKGTTIGFLSYSNFPAEGHFYFDDRPDVAYADEKNLDTEIRKAKESCDILIVSFHWGKEFSFSASEKQKSLAHLAADSGADIVAGQHPHVLQGVEKYKDAFIFYSLGSFVFDHQIQPGTDESVVLKLNIIGKQLKSLVLVPIKIVNCQPIACSGETASSILKKLKSYSEGMNTSFDVEGNVGFVK